MRPRADEKWRQLEHGTVGDAYKLEMTGRAGISIAAYLWLAFYVLAVTHSLLSPRLSPTVAVAHAEETAPLD